MTKKDIHILVVDDEESLRGVISQILTEEGYHVTEAGSGEQAVELFREYPFPLVVTDIRMNGMSGTQLLEQIKNQYPDTQVIMITSHASLDSAILTMRLGAYDYLVKPFDDIQMVLNVVNRAVDKIRLITENQVLVDTLRRHNEDLERVNLKISELAIRDGLTGLYNHRYFQEALSSEVDRSRRHERTFSLIFMDVDFFKRYNDAHGHVQGDKLLCTLAKKIRDRLRATDIIARYGGEEFVLILPEVSKEGARVFAEVIRSYISDYPFEGRETQPHGKVTVSMGVASFPEDGDDGPSLVSHADQAMYQAKRKGRNIVL